MYLRTKKILKTQGKYVVKIDTNTTTYLNKNILHHLITIFCGRAQSELLDICKVCSNIKLFNEQCRIEFHLSGEKSFD